MVSELSRILLQSIDNVMVGQLGAHALAAILLANSLFWLPLTFGDGLCRGFVPLMAKAKAQKKYEKVASLLQNAFLINAVIGVILFLITLLLAYSLYFLNQNQTVVQLAIPYLHMIGASLIPFMLFRTIEKYQHALLHPKPATYITFIGMGVNVVLNYCFIYGKAGFPTMGLTGAGVATLVSRILMAILGTGWLLSSSRARKHLAYFDFKLFSFSTMKGLFKLGVPTSFQISIEVIAGTITVIIVGWIGVEAQAINAILMNFSIFVYVAGTSIASSAAAKIGHYWGHADFRMVKKVSTTTLITAALFISIPGMIFFLGNHRLPLLFTNDLAVQRGVTALLPILFVFMVFDIFHTSAVGVLRGMHEATIPMWITMFSNWCVSLPLGTFLAFYWQWGIFGLWSGAAIAFAFSALVLWIRIYRKASYLLESAPS